MLLHQLTGSRQPACVTSLDSTGTWTAVDRNSCLLLSSLGPLLTFAGLLAVLTDNGFGQHRAMTLRRLSVVWPCLMQFMITLLQPPVALGSSWWLGPLASVVLALSNQDTASATAAQASVLYTLTVSSVAVDFGREVGRIAGTAPAAAGASTDLQDGRFLAAPLSQLLRRVMALAALHILLAIAGTCVTGSKCLANDVGEDTHLQRNLHSTKRHRRLMAMRLQLRRPFISEGGIEKAAAGSRFLEAFASLGGPGAVGPDEEQHEDGVSLASQRQDWERLTGSTKVQRQAQARQQQLLQHHEHLQKQQQTQQQQQYGQGEEEAGGPELDDDFMTEQRQVAAARLADVALLAFDFLQASRCLVAGLRPAQRAQAQDSNGGGGSGSSNGATVGTAGTDVLGPLVGLPPGAEAAALRRMRWLGALLVTSWGTTMLIMNVIIILWPRPRRPRYATVVNSACSWLAASARAALLVLLAPVLRSAATASGAAPPAASAAAAHKANWPSVISGGGEAVRSEQAALTAAVMLMSHLLASNLSPQSYSVQSILAALASALLHRLLLPTAPALVLIATYGSLWLAAAAISYSLARTHPRSHSRVTVASSHRPPCRQSSCTAASARGGDEEQQLTKGELLQAPHGSLMTSSREVLQAPTLRFGPGVTNNITGTNGTASNPGTIAPSNAAVSDLALRTLSRSISPRRCPQGPLPPHFPRSHSGVSGPCTVWPQESNPMRNGHSRAISQSLQGGNPTFQISPGAGHINASAAARGLAVSGLARPISVGAATTTPAASATAAAATHRLQVTKRVSLDSLPPKSVPVKRASMRERDAATVAAAVGISRAPQPAIAIAIASTAMATATAAAVAPTRISGADVDRRAAVAGSRIGGQSLPVRSSVCGTGLDAVVVETGKSATAAAAAKEFAASRVRRTLSERPLCLNPAVTAATVSVASSLKQAHSCGPSQAHDGRPVQPFVLDGTTRTSSAIVAATAVAPAAATAAVSGSLGNGATRAMNSTWFPTSSQGLPPAAWAGSSAVRVPYGSVDGTAVVVAPTTSQGPGAPLVARTLSPLGSMSGAIPATNDNFMLSSVIIEADAYDRLLSSASSPFLLNPNAAPMRLPSSMNTGALAPLPISGHLPSPNSREPPGAYSQNLQQQQYPQQPRQPMGCQWLNNPNSSGLSEAWSAYGTAATASIGGGGGGGSRQLSFRVPLTHRRIQISDAEEDELRSGDGVPRSGGGGGSNESRRGRGAWSARSRSDMAPPAVAEAEAEAPRQVIVLSDGRQVYQSETLAAAASASTVSSSTRLPSERTWAGRRDLLASMARSENDALAAGRAAAAAEYSPTPTIVFSRHLSYTAGGGRGGRGRDPAAGSAGGQSSAMEQLSLSPASYSPQSGSVALRDGKWSGGGGGSEAVGRQPSRGVIGSFVQPGALWPPPPPPSQAAPLQRTMSVGAPAAAAETSVYGTNASSTATARAAAAAATGRGEHRSIGFGRPSLFGDSTSGRSSYTRGAAAGSSGGAFTMFGTSAPTSFGTLGTGSSFSGGASPAGAGPASAGGGGGGGVETRTTSYSRRGSLDLGRHLHDTGLIRIGEEEAGLGNDDDERLTSTLFGTCDDGDGFIGTAGGGTDRRISSGGGYSFGHGSEIDGRSSPAGRVSNGETPPSRCDGLPVTASSYGSSNISSVTVGRVCGSSSCGSAVTGGDASGSVPLVSGHGSPAARQQLRYRRGQFRTGRAGRGSLSRQQLHTVIPADISALGCSGAAARGGGGSGGGGGGGGGGGASISGSSWSATGPISSIDVHHGVSTDAGSGNGAIRPGSGASGAGAGWRGMLQGKSYRELSNPPMLQALLHTNLSVPSSSGFLPQLHATTMARASAAGVGGSGGGGSGGGGSGGGGSGSGGGGSGGGGGDGGRGAAAAAAVGSSAVCSGRHLVSGSSYRSSSNPSLLSFADVTLGFNLSPVTSAMVPANTTSSYSHGGQSATATALASGGGAIMVTLARGILIGSPESSAGAEDPSITGTIAAAVAPGGVVPAVPALRGGAVGPVGASGLVSGAISDDKSDGALQFMAYPQTLALMPGSGSLGRGTPAALRVTATTTSALAAGATKRSNASACTAAVGSSSDMRSSSRPTLSELLASTAAAAAAIGSTSAGHGGTSMWVSPTSSTHLACAAVAMAASPGAPLPPGHHPAQGSSSFTVLKQVNLKSFRMQLNVSSPEDGSGDGAGTAAGASCLMGDGSQPTADTSVSADSAVAATATPSQPPPRRLPQRRGISWFGSILASRRTSTIGTGGGGGGGDFFLSASGGDAPPTSSPLPAQPQHPYERGGLDGSGGSGGSGGSESQPLDGRVSAASGAAAAGRSSQQLTRLMDDTARLSPVRGVLRGLRKRIRSGVKSLSGGVSTRS
ncbi:hypothetical protein Vafri_8699 [Volvox africanus]|nr:hypothetical protein Vafri_8699 [Volvox africanus]